MRIEVMYYSKSEMKHLTALFDKTTHGKSSMKGCDMVFEARYVGFNFSVLDPRNKSRFHSIEACPFTRLQDFKAARKNVCQLPSI